MNLVNSPALHRVCHLTSITLLLHELNWWHKTCPVCWVALKQVREKTAFSIDFFIVHHIKITMHLPYCDPKLVHNNNTKINYTLEKCVTFS